MLTSRIANSAKSENALSGPVPARVPVGYKNAVGSRLVLFFLSPRLIDFDTYLPIAMELKAREPAWDIRFATFSAANYRFILANPTMMTGLAQCGCLHYLGSERLDVAGAPRPHDRLRRRLTAFFKVSRWLVEARDAILFHGRHFSDGPYALWYLLARLRRGRGYILARSRLVDQGMHELFRERFEAVTEERSWLARLAGRDADGLIHYHDRQPIYLRSMGNSGNVTALGKLVLGAPNRLPAWTRLIAEETRIERRRLAAAGHTVDEIYAFLATKAFSSTALRSDDSVADTFRQVIDMLRRLRPNATILVRPHPLAVNEGYLVDTLAALADPNVIVTLAHPEVLISLARRTIVNAPTNILFTSQEGRFIDCTDYRPEDLAQRGSDGFAAGFGTMYVSPVAQEFETRLAAALDDRMWEDCPELTAERERLAAENPPRFEAFMAALGGGH